MKKMCSATICSPLGQQKFELGNKYAQRVFIENHRGFEILLSVGDNLSDYAEYYGRVTDFDGKQIKNAHPSVHSRSQAMRQDRRLIGRDFIVLPNTMYGGWLRAFEGNKYGASDELAWTPEPVRQPLDEPVAPIKYTDVDGKIQIADSIGAKIEHQSLPGSSC
jgi:hypothetical protein